MVQSGCPKLLGVTECTATQNKTLITIFQRAYNPELNAALQLMLGRWHLCHPSLLTIRTHPSALVYVKKTVHPMLQTLLWCLKGVTWQVHIRPFSLCLRLCLPRVCLPTCCTELDDGVVLLTYTVCSVQVTVLGRMNVDHVRPASEQLAG